MVHDRGGPAPTTVASTTFVPTTFVSATFVPTVAHHACGLRLFPQSELRRAMAASTAALGLGVRLKVVRSSVCRPNCGL